MVPHRWFRTYGSARQVPRLILAALMLTLGVSAQEPMPAGPHDLGACRVRGNQAAAECVGQHRRAGIPDAWPDDGAAAVTGGTRWRVHHRGNRSGALPCRHDRRTAITARRVVAQISPRERRRHSRISTQYSSGCRRRNRDVLGPGGYTIHNLPPGEYLVVASGDVEPGEWYDPTFLQRMAGAATRITVVEYEKRMLNVTCQGD